jgi:hypothetical protein
MEIQSISGIRVVQSIPSNSPLFDDLYKRNQEQRQEQIKKEIRGTRIEDQTQISPLGQLFSDLEGIVNPMEIAVKLKLACTNLGISEVDLRKYAANKQFLTNIHDKGGYQSISEADKILLLAKLVSYGIKCPVQGAFETSLKLGLRKESLINFSSEDINRTFRNEYVASQNRLRDFANRYSSLFQ